MSNTMIVHIDGKKFNGVVKVFDIPVKLYGRESYVCLEIQCNDTNIKEGVKKVVIEWPVELFQFVLNPSNLLFEVNGEIVIHHDTLTNIMLQERQTEHVIALPKNLQKIRIYLFGKDILSSLHIPSNTIPCFIGSTKHMPITLTKLLITKYYLIKDYKGIFSTNITVSYDYDYLRDLVFMCTYLTYIPITLQKLLPILKDLELNLSKIKFPYQIEHVYLASKTSCHHNELTFFWDLILHDAYIKDFLFEENYNITENHLIENEMFWFNIHSNLDNIMYNEFEREFEINFNQLSFRKIHQHVSLTKGLELYTSDIRLTTPINLMLPIVLNKDVLDFYIDLVMCDEHTNTNDFLYDDLVQPKYTNLLECYLSTLTLVNSYCYDRLVYTPSYLALLQTTIPFNTDICYLSEQPKNVELTTIYFNQSCNLVYPINADACWFYRNLVDHSGCIFDVFYYQNISNTSNLDLSCIKITRPFVYNISTNISSTFNLVSTLSFDYLVNKQSEMNSIQFYIPICLTQDVNILSDIFHFYINNVINPESMFDLVSNDMV